VGDHNSHTNLASPNVGDDMPNRITNHFKEPKNRRNTEPKPKKKKDEPLLIIEEETPQPSKVKIRNSGAFVMVDSPDAPDPDIEN
jgi:hypothetical protein